MLNQNWVENENHLEKKFEFKTYSKMILFVNSVAWLSEKNNHHPQMILDYKVCTILLTTHDQNNQITIKDRELARAIDELV